MKIYTISMKSSLSRRNFHSKQANEYQIKINYLDAIDGSTLSEKLFESLRYTYLRPLSRGEVGCFLSHKRLWEECLSSNEPIIILEDDAILSPAFMDAVSQLTPLTGIDRINLEGYYPQKKTFGKSMLQLDNFSLTEIYQERAGAAAYMLWPSGAEKLLNFYHNKATLADVALKKRFLITYQLEPVVAVQALICEHYNIQHQLQYDKTTLDPTGKHKGYSPFWALVLKCKRIFSELQKSGINLRYVFKTRRYVFVDKNQFNQK